MLETSYIEIGLIFRFSPSEGVLTEISKIKKKSVLESTVTSIIQILKCITTYIDDISKLFVSKEVTILMLVLQKSTALGDLIA